MLTKAAIFIDGGYLSKIVKKFFPTARIDLLKFSENLCVDYERVQSYYYNCMPYQSGYPTLEERRRYARMDRFINIVRGLDKFTVQLGRLLRKNDGTFEQKGVDVQLSLDLVELASMKSIEKAYIVSGDSDFVPAVKKANLLGVITQNVYHVVEFSYHLRDVCIEKRKLDQDLVDTSQLVFTTRRAR